MHTTESMLMVDGDVPQSDTKKRGASEECPARENVTWSGGYCTVTGMVISPVVP